MAATAIALLFVMPAFLIVGDSDACIVMHVRQVMQITD